MSRRHACRDDGQQILKLTDVVDSLGSRLGRPDVRASLEEREEPGPSGQAATGCVAACRGRDRRPLSMTCRYFGSPVRPTTGEDGATTNSEDVVRGTPMG